MTLTVRNASVTGAVTAGRALTYAEMDANFAHLSDSANQSFVQSGSGATSRNIQDVLRERCVSVTDFGAVGDGIQDDSPAFQKAHDALSAYGGTILVPVPSNNWYLASAVSITKRCRWVGLGRLAAPIVCGTANNAFTATFTGGYLEFENLYIQGDASSGTTGTALNVVGTDGSNHLSFLTVRNCYIKNFSAPIVTKFADHILLQSVFVHQDISGVVTGEMIKHTFGTGIYWHKVELNGSGATLPAKGATIGSDVDTFCVTDSNIYHCGGIAFTNVETGKSFAPRYIRLTDLIVESGKASTDTSDSCFYFAAGRDIILNNCTGLDGYYGIYLNGATVVQVNGGTLYLMQRHSLFINAGSNVHVRGLVVIDGSQDTTNTYRGVLVTGSLTKFSIRGCVIRSEVVTSGKTMQYGISIGNSCSDFAVTDNELGNFGTAAYNLGTGHTGYVYRGNRVDDDALQGSMTCANATSTTVTNKNIHPYTRVAITATNSGAAGLTGVYVSAKTSNTSFTVTHSSAAGTETFDYVVNS